MKTKISMAASMKLALVFAVICCVTVAGTASSNAQVQGPPQAAVQAVQGEASVVVDRDQEPVKLAVGSMVDAWNTVSTSENGKLFLKWKTGLLNSLGSSSSMFLATRETEHGPADVIEITQGLLRVTKPSGGSSGAPYMVLTPAASIEPVSSDEPVDFIVEVYVPTTAVVTVISGNVRVKNLTLTRPVDTDLSSCQTVYVEEGKPKLESLSSSSEDLKRLVDGTTIPGTIVANLDICPVTPSQPRVAERRVSPGPRYAESSSYSDYDFEDWESQDVYPYDEIRVLEPQPGLGVVVILPGVGRWIIPVDAFTGWRFDPAVIAIYARRLILDNIIYSDQYYLADLRLQQRQYRDLAYLSQLSGNRGRLWEAQRQLANVNIQEDWAMRRLNRLEKNVTSLKQEEHKFANKLPSGKNLFQAVSSSFNSPKNLKVVQNFRDKMKTDLNVQAQLAGVAGKELIDLRSRVANERDPQKRLALRDELSKINQDVIQGKLPIPAKQTQVKQVVEKLTKEQDPKKVQNLQKQLGRLTKTEAPRSADLLTPDKLASLKQDLAKFPNPQKRKDLEAQVAQLGQSVEQRKRAELTNQKIDSITTQAAKQGDVRKRDELLGQLKELGKTPEAGPAGRLDFLGQRRNLESQLAIEQDKQKRAGLEKALDEQRKKQSEMVGQQPEKGQQPAQPRGGQGDLRKQTESQQLERQKQTDQKLRQQEQADQTQRQEKQQQQRQEQVQQKQHERQQEQAEQLKTQQGQAEQKRRQQEQTEQSHKQEQQVDQKRRQQEQADQTQRLEKQQQQRQEQVQQQQHQRQQEQAEQTHKREQQQVDQKRRQQEESQQSQRQQQQREQVQQQHQQQQRQEQVQQQQHQRQQEQAEQGRRQQQQQQAEQSHRQQQQREQVQQQQPQQHREQPQQPQQQPPHVQQQQMPQQRPQPQAPQQQQKEEPGHQRK